MITRVIGKEMRLIGEVQWGNKTCIEETLIIPLNDISIMPLTLKELSDKVERIERFLKTLIDVNLELIEEVEPEEWEVRDIEDRKRDEFIRWEEVQNEL
ncbi:hypothetical protein [Ferroglobus sp.]|uniref:hypothetical protein n=1 Tax=Ferroglobus sp. TaxID=2614230 RepID=UPI0025C6625C|nr:hypothetical protein [Ferroglobus sp.]